MVLLTFPQNRGAKKSKIVLKREREEIVLIVK
jgi:hypothetical protein